MVSDFELAIGSVCRIGFVVKAAVGERATEAFVEEQEQEGHLHAFRCEAVGVAAAVALQQAMAFEFAQIVAELVQPVGLRRELERGEDGGVNLLVQPPTVLPPCRRTSSSRMIRASWILIPG